MSERFSFVLDGASVTVDADPKAPALSVLREQLGIRGCKAGCSPQGLCGCCTVLVDGKPRLTCTLPTKSLAGKVLTTLDGVPEADRHLLADSFVRAGAAQCGYCTPGIVLSAWALLQGDTAPGPEAVTRALNPHACRCTGYMAIHAAIEDAAARRRGEGSPAGGHRAAAPADGARAPAVGAAAPLRPEARDVVLGDRPYVDDLARPGMLHGAVVLAPAARGVLRRVDLGGAPGVVLREAGAELAHAGEIVAAVVAEDAAAARQRAAAAVVELDEEPPRPDERVAAGRRVDDDVDAALAACAHRVEGTYRLAPTDPVFLEPEAALAVPVVGDDGAAALVVYSQGHDAAGEARALGAALGVPVRVVLVPSGGSYGGKEASTVQEAAARLALGTGRPVRVAATLEQGMRLHRRRPGATVTVRAGCDVTGGGLVLVVDARFDGGADAFGADRVVAQALGALPYTATADVRASVVRTGGSATAPIRGAGGLAVTFAVERALDALAAAAGLDRFELRARNVEGEAAAVLAALGPAWQAALGEGAEAAAAERAAPAEGAGAGGGAVRGGVGIGLGRVDGAGGARVVITVTGPDAVEVQCNVPDLGQFRDEALIVALTAATGLPPAAFDIAWSESNVVGAAAPGGASVTVAARRAAEALAAAGGGLSGLLGRRFVGEDTARAPAGWAAQLARVDGAGLLRGVTVAFAVGDDQDLAHAARLAEGAAHMGVGVALSEEVGENDGVPEARFRMLGVMKPKGSPELVALPVRVGGAPREIAEAVILPAPAAVAGALDASGAVHHALPMRDTAAARGVGARPVRPAAR